MFEARGLQDTLTDNIYCAYNVCQICNLFFTLQMLIGLFERCMKRRGVKDSDPYDWEKIPSAGDGVPVTQPVPTALSTLARHTTTRLNTTATTVDNNQENIEPQTDNNKEAQMEARRRRIETETTAPLVTETQTNAPRAVDKNCNATAADTAPIQSMKIMRYMIKSIY